MKNDFKTSENNSPEEAARKIFSDNNLQFDEKYNQKMIKNNNTINQNNLPKETVKDTLSDDDDVVKDMYISKQTITGSAFLFRFCPFSVCPYFPWQYCKVLI